MNLYKNQLEARYEINLEELSQRDKIKLATWLTVQIDNMTDAVRNIHNAWIAWPYVDIMNTNNEIKLIKIKDEANEILSDMKDLLQEISPF